MGEGYKYVEDRNCFDTPNRGIIAKDSKVRAKLLSAHVMGTELVCIQITQHKRHSFIVTLLLFFLSIS